MIEYEMKNIGEKKMWELLIVIGGKKEEYENEV